MKKYEQDALVKIAKSRFEIVRAQLQQRRQEITTTLTGLIEGQAEPARKKAARRVAALDKKAETLAQEARDIRDEARQDGVELETGYGRLPVFKYEVNGAEADEWKPAGLAARVRGAVAKLEVEAGAAGLGLAETEQLTLERIYVESLDSSEAKELFDAIPTVDKVLPLPSADELKQLTR